MHWMKAIFWILHLEPDRWSVRFLPVTPIERDDVMNWDILEGKWKQFTGSAKENWGKLTDDDLDQAAGKRDILVGKIQEKYGIARDEAEKQVDDWSSKI
jgi:uncharacterized protein YjbJ (UPF0337 family)